MRNRTNHGKGTGKTGSNAPGSSGLAVVPERSAKSASPAQQADPSPSSTAGGVVSSAAGPQLVESLASQVDRLGHLRAVLADYTTKAAPMKAAAEALERKILDRYKDLAAEQIAVVEGDRYTLKIGAQAEEQSVVTGGMKRVFEWVGADKFIERAKVTLETLKGILTAEQYSEVITKARTGRRSMTVTAKVAAEVPPAA